MRVVLGLLAALAVGGAGFLLGMRYKVPLVVDGVRRMNKRFMNPGQLAKAGRPGSYAGIIHHVGRTSGTFYQTPIGVESHPDGFYVFLPYGSRADWVRNVLAAGEATIDHEGETYQVTNPRIVGRTEIDDHLTGSNRTTANLFDIDEFLVVSADR